MSAGFIVNMNCHESITNFPSIIFMSNSWPIRGNSCEEKHPFNPYNLCSIVLRFLRFLRDTSSLQFTSSVFNNSASSGFNVSQKTQKTQNISVKSVCNNLRPLRFLRDLSSLQSASSVFSNSVPSALSARHFIPSIRLIRVQQFCALCVFCETPHPCNL